jgi:thiaminase/transcriptional activator TenA
MADQTLFESLNSGSGGLWSAAQEHPFVAGIGDGSLDLERFLYFLKQDYVYLIAYSRAIALAAAKAQNLQLLSDFTALAHETLNVEMAMHREYCAKFRITAEELDRVEPSPVCRAYSDFCIASAATGDSPYLLAALIPCGVGYAEIGARLRQQQASTVENPYEDWIEVYAGGEYRKYADWMVATLDRLGTELPESRMPGLQLLFNTGCRYEWLFWEMAWTMQAWPL